MALHTELPIYKVAYDLLNLVTEITRSMPRDFKASIGAKISNETMEVIVLIFRANVSRQKTEYLTDLIERLQVTELLLRLSRVLTGLSSADYSSPVVEKNTNGFDSLELRSNESRSTLVRGFFIVQRSTSIGRAVWEGETPAGSVGRSVNLHSSAHPFDRGLAVLKPQLRTSPWSKNHRGKTRPSNSRTRHVPKVSISRTSSTTTSRNSQLYSKPSRKSMGKSIQLSISFPNLEDTCVTIGATTQTSVENRLKNISTHFMKSFIRWSPPMADFNPIIVNGCWNADTADNLRSVLEFMADAMPMLQQGGFNKDTAHGAFIILRTCAATLEICSEGNNQHSIGGAI